MSGNISEPSVTLNIVAASQAASVADQKVLIVGQMLSAGSATAGVLQQDIGNAGEENDLFGRKSHVAGMVRAFKEHNKLSQLDVIPLDDSGTAVDATATIAFTGTATEDGTLTIIVGSETNHKYELDILSGDTATEIGVAADALIDLDLDIPFTPSNATGTLTITADNGGTLANNWDIKCTGTVAGVTYTVTGFASGANDPTLTSILDVIDNIRYQTVVWPSAYALTVIEAELNARFNVTNDVMDGVCIQVYPATLANVEAYAVQNSQSVVVVANNIVSTDNHKGSAIIEFPDVIASQIAAIRALRLTDGASLTGFLTSVARSDQFGGMELASLPYFNTALTNLVVPTASDFFAKTDVDDMVDNAVSVIGPNRAYSAVVMGEFVTTYETNAAGNADTSYKFLNTVDTASVIREYFFNNLKSRYAQTRLTDGDLIAGRDMANAASIRSYCNKLYDDLALMALVQSGSTAKADFDENLVITTTVSTGAVTIDMAPLLVSQLRVVTGTIQINFGS